MTEDVLCSPTLELRRSRWLISSGLFAVLLLAFWFAAQYFGVSDRIRAHLTSAFISFALLLAPYWAFGFGLADSLRHVLQKRVLRVLAPGVLVIAYAVFAVPAGQFDWFYALTLFALPVGMSALFEFVPPRHPGLCWQDVAVLASLGLPVEFHLITRHFTLVGMNLGGAWPQPGLSAMSKLLLVDAGLYAYLVVRRLDGVGYDFRLRGRDLLIGMREWAAFAPLAIGLGLALHFIQFHARVPGIGHAAGAWLVTFFFVAIPEELFFRGLLQNLLEHRVGRLGALLIASPIFGLSHFNKGPVFNWRYVLLATIAGLFYGRAWRDRRRLFCSGITHASVDVVWGLWFR